MVATFNKTIRKHIFLHPGDKKRRHAALRAALLKDKRKYSDKLEGALLDVKNLKVVGGRHLVVEGYISMEVEADCLVFSPQPGQILEGVVNKKSFSHLGCLVMEIFNASLSMPSSQASMPQLGDLVSFVVTEVIVDGEILFLKGTLESIISHSVPVKQEPKAFVKEEDTSETPADVDQSGDASLSEDMAVKTEPSTFDSPEKSKKKKKKKKKEKDTD
ncbi:DNA-directed RNA polymerase i subunit rpa43 [Plakobranchus ocellatus]|uniref:DNA-directed RNA polymerase i subunit rpa43 n=1 Tax=Plakobranchus ocellatus TaxID=259542 RepID=A0AAV3ZW91_9GAST|nr:DNA-directed RNA polymerase i subunit rpa43 [Plakobranchus ocellatus]